MAYVHIAHDCVLGNETVLANNTTLAGHVSIDNFVILGGFTGVHQFCHIGEHSFSAIASVILKDVPPFIMMAGNSAKPSGLNKEGLKRHGFSFDTIRKLKKAYKIVYRNGLLLKDALGELEDSKIACAEVSQFLNFITTSERGIAR
jgi:UDP-N-acetylglucosamine acyltransferase